LKDKKNAVIVIGIFAALITVAIISVIFFPKVFRSTSINLSKDGNRMDIPTIESYVKSEDGEEHRLRVNFSITIDGDKSYRESDLQNYIKDAVDELKYEEISGEGGVEYIKNEVMEKLSEHIESGELSGIYISDLAVGDLIFPEKAAEKKNNVDELLEGINKGTKK